MKQKFLVQGIVALAVVWALVWVVSQAADAAMPSSRKLLAYLRTEPLGNEPHEAVIERVAREYNRLGFVDKRSLRARDGQGVFEQFLEQLTTEEKLRFVDLVMPPQFQQLLDGFSRMSEADRLKVLTRSKRELIEHLPNSPARTALEQANAEVLNHFAKQGLGPIYNQLPPELKLQLLPFIEQMQNNMRKLDD